MAPDPTVTAVQRVLHAPARTRRLNDDLHTIGLLMNLSEANPLGPNDSRLKAGAGPTWYYPDTGRLSSSVLQAAQRCDRVAATLFQMRDDLGRLSMSPTDKRYLRLGLAELSASWSARARAWRAAPGQNVHADAAVIRNHLQASHAAFVRVRKYLEKPGG